MDFQCNKCDVKLITVSCYTFDDFDSDTIYCSDCYEEARQLKVDKTFYYQQLVQALENAKENWEDLNVLGRIKFLTSQLWNSTERFE